MTPRVEEMTGADVEVICGEWEVGNVPPDVSGELYNVILQVQEIRRHPGYEINQGVLRTNYLQNDLSVIFVEVNFWRFSFYFWLDTLFNAG